MPASIHTFAVTLILLLSPIITSAETTFPNFSEPPHNYWQQEPKDLFTKIKSDLGSGRLKFDTSSEKAFVTGILKALDIPVSSQLLVFSTTSLQLRLINYRNPRALYFNEEIYLGWVPNGKIEVISIDPDIGGVFHIFNIPRTPEPPTIERSTRCMNCHAGHDVGRVPVLLAKSVVPGPNGGTLDSFRIGKTGHGIPLSERFGGWYLTGTPNIPKHWGNRTGELSPAGLKTTPVEPGRHFDWNRYPRSTSNILPHLLHEHQVGFVNRVVPATYRARALIDAGKGVLSGEALKILDKDALELARYLLFADETPLPAGGIQGDPAYIRDFQRNRRPSSVGSALKDLDLRTRLFKHRCSYMIYSLAFQGMPKPLKERVLRRMGKALNPTQPDPAFAYLPTMEKSAIRRILWETLPAVSKL
jgi:hypothetical protein